MVRSTEISVVPQSSAICIEEESECVVDIFTNGTKITRKANVLEGTKSPQRDID